jgi:hypothetical protein
VVTKISSLFVDESRLIISSFNISYGASVAEWLRSLTSKPLAPHLAVGSNPDRDFGFFHVRKLSIIMHGRAPEVLLHQLSWNVAN